MLFGRREYDVEKQAVGKLKEEAAMLGIFHQTFMKLEVRNNSQGVVGMQRRFCTYIGTFG